MKLLDFTSLFKGAGAVGMQVANVKHSHCEAKLGLRVWANLGVYTAMHIASGRVRRKNRTIGVNLGIFSLYLVTPI